MAPPAEGELGVRVPGDDDSAADERQFLVVAQRRGLSSSFRRRDRELLTGLADIGATALTRAELHDELDRRATRDELTGLANRWLGIATFERMVAAARRQGTAVAVLFVDVNRLRLVNDQHGHEAGDALLAEVAERLVHQARESDLVGRWGGDGQDPVEVRPATIRTLERIRNDLTGNVPTVRGLHGPVVTVTPDTTVADAALTMADRDYTCLPVEVRGDVVGAVDSDMVMHWLADGLGTDGLIEDTTVGDLRAARPDPPVRFLRADSAQRAAVAAFEDALRDGELTAAILLTPEGTARDPLRGIITPWDVASLDR